MQVVFERTADQVFDRQIINPFGVDFVIAGDRLVHPVHGELAHRERNYFQRFFLADLAGALADKIFGIMFD